MGCRSSKVFDVKNDEKRAGKAKASDSPTTNKRAVGGASTGKNGGPSQTNAYLTTTNWVDPGTCDNGQHHHAHHSGTTGGATYGGDSGAGGGGYSGGDSSGGGGYSGGGDHSSGGGSGGGDTSTSF